MIYCGALWAQPCTPYQIERGRQLDNWADPNKQHHRLQSIINLNMTYSNTQHKPIKFFQSKNHGHNTYWKAQHTQHSQLNSHKSTCLWKLQRSKSL